MNRSSGQRKATAGVVAEGVETKTTMMVAAATAIIDDSGRGR